MANRSPIWTRVCKDHLDLLLSGLAQCGWDVAQLEAAALRHGYAFSRGEWGRFFEEFQAGWRVVTKSLAPAMEGVV